MKKRVIWSLVLILAAMGILAGLNALQRRTPPWFGMSPWVGNSGWLKVKKMGSILPYPTKYYIFHTNTITTTISVNDSVVSKNSRAYFEIDLWNSAGIKDIKVFGIDGDGTEYRLIRTEAEKAEQNIKYDISWELGTDGEDKTGHISLQVDNKLICSLKLVVENKRGTITEGIIDLSKVGK